MAEGLLEVNNIETYYGPIMAIRGISFGVPRGAIVTILGANGAGKTTILKTVSGVMEPQKGTVTFEGRALRGLDPDKVMRLGLSHVPEGREVFPLLTVRENLKMGAYTRTDAGAVAQDMQMVYDYFPVLAMRAEQRAGLLSGGEQQMLSISRALMARPKMMLLDEPSLGLSPLLVKVLAWGFAVSPEKVALTISLNRMMFPYIFFISLSAIMSGILNGFDVFALPAFTPVLLNAAIIAAGTGLGEAGLYWDGRTHHPFATEGGHANFGASDAVESELLHWLSTQFGHVSWERLVSGPGLVNVYRFLRDTHRGEEPGWLAEEMRARDPAAVISDAAQSGKSPLCLQALDLFMGLYGSEAGNLALKIMATGGVYVGGGIAPKNLDKLKDGTFMKRFVAKGRMQRLLETMPVKVILNDKTALLGAARCAAVRSGLT